jgi:hypothetical protein
MRRLPLLALLAAALAAGCVHEAPGACADDDGCRAGEHCAGGVCLRNGQVALGGACELQAECASWATCAAGRCALRPGACEAEPHCAAWQDCGPAHACVLAPGMCDGEGDCAAWRSCLAHGCVLDAGRCEGHGDCAGWQYCDAGHTCQDVGATCAGDGDCQAWQVCTTGHCANRPGACGADEQCDPAWQVCGAEHACVAAPGFCASSSGCEGWESCGPDHVCRAGLMCRGDGDCVGGDSCSIGAGAIAGVCVGPFSCDPAGITIWGDLIEGIGSGVLAPLHAPTRVRPGFSGEWDGWITAAGHFVYTRDEPGGFVLRRLVPDAWRYVAEDDRWAYPEYASTADNDPLLPTPACTSVAGVVLQAGGDGYIYRCNVSSTPLRYYDAEGNLAVEGFSVAAWNAAGVKLASSFATGTVLLHPSGATTPVTGFSGFESFQGGRVRGDGFWRVDGTWSGYRRWYIGPDGAAAMEGDYARPGAPLDFCYFHALDAAGDLYCVASDGGGVDVVMRCPLEPGTCEAVYDETDAPPTDWTVYPPRGFAYLHGGQLVTGP